MHIKKFHQLGTSITSFFVKPFVLHFKALQCICRQNAARHCRGLKKKNLCLAYIKRAPEVHRGKTHCCGSLRQQCL